MKILMTPTMALGALCILAMNQPVTAGISDDPNFHLVHSGVHEGGVHAGARPMGGAHNGNVAGRDRGPHDEGRGHHEEGRGHHDVRRGAVGGFIGTTIINENIYEEVPSSGDIYEGDTYQDSYSEDDCYDEDGNYICNY